MQHQDNQAYKWLVKRGSILLFEDNHQIHLELERENGESCLLVKEDAEEIIAILTSLAEAIWNSPGFTKEPYKEPLYKTDHNGQVYWEVAQSRLYAGFNASEKAIEINYSGDTALKVPVNYAVEIIQFLMHYYKQY